MNNSQTNLLATVSTAHCLRSFLTIQPFLRNAVNNAFRLDWMKGNRDDALYWKKQATVLGRMQLQAKNALDLVPTVEGHQFGFGSRNFEHLASASVYRLMMEVAKECVTDLVTHHGDFVTALETEAQFFLAEDVRETLVHEKPLTAATLHALNDIKDLAASVLAALELSKEPSETAA